ncbi:MAG: hypothetical protein ACTHK7_13235 [Aureliella sp.]
MILAALAFALLSMTGAIDAHAGVIICLADSDACLAVPAEGHSDLPAPLAHRAKLTDGGGFGALPAPSPVKLITAAHVQSAFDADVASEPLWDGYRIFFPNPPPAELLRPS